MPIFEPMENFNINITRQQQDLLKQPDADLTTFLNTLFAPLSANYTQLALELQREFRQAGSPDITAMVIDRVKYNPATGKGSFRVVLDVRFSFLCEDAITEKEDQTSEWTFALNAGEDAISFYSSPFAESRSTADEF